MSELKYSSTKHGSVMLIKIGGSLDAETAPRLNKKLQEEIKKGTQNIVIDMAKLDYIASAGLGVLISFNQLVAKKGGKIKISLMSDKIRKIFKLLGFANLFEIYEDDEEAMAAF